MGLSPMPGNVGGMAAQLLGAHIPVKGGLGAALREGAKIGCAAVQVFTASPRQWRAPAISGEQIADFKRAQAETGIQSVVSHDSYLVNLIAPTDEIAAKSFASLKQELGRCAAYGIRLCVSHLGSAKGRCLGEALLAVSEAVLAVLDESDPSVTLLMETTAGQGSDLNHRFEELAMILELTKGPKRLGVCLDTCHVFAAGYDIRTPEGFSKTFADFDRLVGLDRLHAIHVNDSLKALGSRVDRHADIGQGEIGDEAFRMLVNDPRFDHIPMLLETESDKHASNLAHLKELRQ